MNFHVIPCSSALVTCVPIYSQLEFVHHSNAAMGKKNTYDEKRFSDGGGRKSNNIDDFRLKPLITSRSASGVMSGYLFCNFPDEPAGGKRERERKRYIYR